MNGRTPFLWVILVSIQMIFSAFPSDGWCDCSLARRDEEQHYKKVKRSLPYGNNVSAQLPVVSFRDKPGRLSSTAAVRARETVTQCGPGDICITMAGDFLDVYGQYGIRYWEPNRQVNLFVPIHMPLAQQVGETDQYRVPSWNGRIFYMKLSQNGHYRALQAYDDGEDPDNPELRIFNVNLVYYRKQGMDYSAYEAGAAACALELYVDASNQVTDYVLLVYDQNHEFVEESAFAPGDQVDALFWGINDDDPSWWYRISLDGFETVEHEPVFYYASWLPGRDIPCKNCWFDLAQSPLYCRLEGWNEDEDENATVAFSDTTYLRRLGEINADAPPQYDMITVDNDSGNCFITAVNRPVNPLLLILSLVLILIWGLLAERVRLKHQEKPSD